MPGYYRCEVCGIDFARKNKLQRHRRRVHGATVRCPHCSAGVPKHRVDRLAEHLCMGRGGASLEVAQETVPAVPEDPLEQYNWDEEPLVCDVIPADSPGAQSDSVGGNGLVAAPADVPGDSSPLAPPTEDPVRPPTGLGTPAHYSREPRSAAERSPPRVAGRAKRVHLGAPSCRPPANPAKVPAARQAHRQIPRRGVVRHQGGARGSARRDRLPAPDDVDS